MRSEKKRHPSVGIFWIVRGRIVAFTEPAQRVPTVGGFKDSRFSHHRMWRSVVCRYPGLTRHEYWERPRGRVLYAVAEDRYRLFLPGQYRGDERLIGRVADRFSLPLAKVKVCLDEHYDRPSESAADD